ncbi:MAG: hypothetical protein ACPL3P_04290, partial [Anaerolineales bacterium]
LALSRILHLDGLLSSFMLLALVSYLYFWKTKRWSALIVCGIASAMSWLTKSPGLFLLPFLGGMTLVLAFVAQKPSGKQAWKNYFGFTSLVLTIWALSLGATSLLLWPALTAKPLQVMHLVLSKGMQSAQEGHEQALFFNGTIYPTGQIGLRVWDFYPINFLFRTTPLTLLGLGLTPLIFLHNRRSSIKRTELIFLIIIALFGLGFMAFMSLGDKKFDRYILPVFPALDLIAALGYFGLFKVGDKQGKFRPWAATIMMILIIAAQALSSLSIFPYMISYYNPLLGGPSRAPQIMDVGEGEGLELAARYLNQKPNAQDLQVFAWYATGCFSYFFNGTTRQIRPMENVTAKRLQSLTKADYVVIYINQQQRGLGRLYLDFVQDKPLEKLITINQIEYVRIYRVQP